MQASRQSEKIKEYGVENGIPFVVSERGTYPNIPCKRYEGNDIPQWMIEEIQNLERQKRQLLEETPKEEFSLGVN